MFRSDEIDLKYYGLVIGRWKRLILTVAGACVGLAFVLNLVMQPIYRAVTRVEISRAPSHSPITGEDLGEDTPTDNVALLTTAELMTNRSLMREVAKTLKERQLLQVNAPRAEFFRRLRDRVTFRTVDPASASLGEGTGPSGRDVDWLLSVLSVKPIRDTRLVKVEVEHWNPRIAKAIADVVVSEFVDYQNNLRSSADTLRLGRMRERIQDENVEIKQLEQHLSGVAGPVLEEKAKQLSGTMGGLNDALVRAQTERMAVDAKLQRVRRMMTDSMYVGSLPVQSEALDAMWHDLLARQAELAQAREVFKERHPRVVMLETELRAIRANIRTELNKTVAALNTERATLMSHEASLRAEIGRNEGQLRSVSGQIGQASTLEGQLKTKQDFYNLLNSRVQEGEVTTAGMRVPQVRVVEPATVEGDPVRPRKALNLILGLVVGLFAGTGLALFLEYLRRAIRTPNDVMEHLQLPVLGMIPRRPH
jgi:succinoglycan biosynthesis transport protein ExoP